MDVTDRPNSTMVPVSSPATFDQQVIMTVVISVLGLWSTLGNVLTIAAICSRKYMKTKTNVFILSLAISDLLSGLIASPLWLYRRSWGFVSWEWGDFLCKLYWFLDETTSYCTALHIAAFAIWRFVLVRWPHRMSTTKIRTIVICVSVIWVLSVTFGGFVYSSFFASMMKPQNGGVYSYWPMCSLSIVDGNIASFKMYYNFSSAIFMMLPMAIVIVMSLLITNELYFNKTFKSELRKVKEKRAVAQLAMIATSFMVGYIPMTTYISWSIRTSSKDKYVDYWVGVGAYFCLRFSECINPIVYNVSSNKMRGASKEVLSDIWTCCGNRGERSRRRNIKISRSSEGDTSERKKKSISSTNVL